MSEKLKVISVSKLGSSPDALNNCYRLTSVLWVMYRVHGHVKTVKIEEGYSTNGANIPPFLWKVFGTPYAPKNIRAAAIHDYAYEHGFGVKEMSDLFMEVLRRDRVGKIKSRLMWLGVLIYTSIFKYKNKEQV